MHEPLCATVKSMELSAAQKPMITNAAYRYALLIIGVLLLVIVGMFALWKPWQAAKDRTITVTGDATLTATPDQFTFSPTYTFKDPDQGTALAALRKKSDDIVSHLKSLGVADKQIKTDTDSTDTAGVVPLYIVEGNNKVYTLHLTVTLTDSTLAQKVQDYLVSTTPEGAVSPQADFSPAKHTALEASARTAAEKDARQKAQEMAKNLGFTLDGIKSVTDAPDFGLPLPLSSNSSLGSSQAMSSVAPPLTVQPGQNNLSYSVQVVYFIH